MLQEVELSVEPDRHLVNYTTMPNPLLVCNNECACNSETVLCELVFALDDKVSYVYEYDF